MNQEVPSRPPPRPRRDWIWPLLIAALIIAASHRSRLASPVDVRHLDKLVHFSVYGLLATLLCRLGAGWRAAGWALLAVSAFGVTDEWHQSFVPGRSTDVLDWIADTLGGALAVALYTACTPYRAALERPLGQRRIENAPAPPTLAGR